MMNEKELLEWYLAAGVDAICGDVPGCLQQKAPPRERPTAVGETASRPAITDLAQMFDEDEIPVNQLFRTFQEMPSLEQKALQLSTGKILDVGAGSG